MRYINNKCKEFHDVRIMLSLLLIKRPGIIFHHGLLKLFIQFFFHFEEYRLTIVLSILLLCSILT